MNKYIFYIPLSLTGLFFTFYFLLASLPNFLSVDPGYAIGDISRWCERISGGFFREPANALAGSLKNPPLILSHHLDISPIAYPGSTDKKLGKEANKK